MSDRRSTGIGLFKRTARGATVGLQFGIWGILFLWTGISTADAQRTSSYAIVIGNNSPPAIDKTTITRLRYADDDAIRMYSFFQRMTNKSYLMTVPDISSQRRYPQIASVAKVPSLQNLYLVVDTLTKKIAAEKASGQKTVVYIYFSGHGTHNEQGIAGLVMSEGLLTRNALYKSVIDVLNADFIHLFVDACYAEGVVGNRGIFDNELESTVIPLSQAERRAAQLPDAMQYPGLGVFVSSTAEQQSQEWSKLQAGVFTHVVLSGMAGLADINDDGEIAYSELYAFVAAANRNVENTKARLNIVASPPQRNQNEPLVDITNIRNAAYITGDLSSWRHFHVEFANGERFLDGHLQNIANSRFWVPANQTVFVYDQEQRETSVRLAKNEYHNVRDMRFARNTIHEKGPVDVALSEGLFASAYSREYYQGIVDSSQMVSVQLPPPAVKEKAVDISTRSDSDRLLDFRRIQTRRRLAISSFVVATVATGMSVMFTALSRQAREDYDDASDPVSAAEVNDRYQYYGNAAWIAGAMVPICIISGILLWPGKNRNQYPSIATGAYPKSSFWMDLTMRF